MSTLPSPSVPAHSAPRDRAGVLADLRARIRRIDCNEWHVTQIGPSR